MAILDRSRAVRAAALLLVCVCAACAFLRSILPGARRFAFSHERHVTIEKLDCANCHPDAFAADEPGMPARDTCEVCHSEIDAELPAGKRVETLFQGAEFAAAHAARLADEVVFSHWLHASGMQDCNACHVGIEHSDDVLDLPRVRMDDCTRCHAQRAVPDEERCAQCHQEVGRQWAPPNHMANWIEGHGPIARDRSAVTAENCSLCHEQSSCDDCHRVQAPANHTPFWHERGHGLVAMADRQNCAACHQPESCEACHSSIMPRNHVATWGGTLSTHCLGCHQPLRYEGCSACHQATPSHLAAPNMPDDDEHAHTPGMNCRKCHQYPGRFMPHVDNGDDCNSCHK